MPASRLLPHDTSVANHLIIAATAAHYGFTVITRDTAEFKRARVPVFNP